MDFEKSGFLLAGFEEGTGKKSGAVYMIIRLMMPGTGKQVEFMTMDADIMAAVKKMPEFQVVSATVILSQIGREWKANLKSIIAIGPKK